MERRAFLRASGAAGLGLAATGHTAARSRRPTARQQDGYEPLGRVAVDGAAEGVVGDDGETAYVATTTGFATVDVSDPAEPTVLATERALEVGDGTLSEILDVTVDGDRLVAAGPANPGYGVMGFRSYDVSDPESPEPVGAYETGYHIHNCYLDGELLFVAANPWQEDRNLLVIYDVGDGDEIEQVGYWSLLDREPGWRDVDFLARYLHDVYVQDDIAYLPYWNAGTYLLDVSDPTDPEYVSHVAKTTLEDQRTTDEAEPAQGLPGNDHYAAVDDTGDLMAVGREAWATGGDEPDRPGGIDLYDVSDPSDPVHRGAIEAPRTVDESYDGGTWTTSHNFELRDGRLYSSWYRGGVKIHDVSEPGEPEELAWWRDPGETAFWTARVVESGKTFLATSTEAIPNTSLDGALYTFPIEVGEQVDPPSLAEPSEWGSAGDETSGSDESGDENGTNDGSDGDEDGSDGGDSIPGFTGLTGAAAGAATLEWLRRRGGNVQD
ncbi:LVIVD repeat-containing protein [Natrinema salifodinae]|uniref:LVIVD repeat-containing protein n=1 Tax=Natrinema salifodinae TaxID=1202768 RepID=A0A1I0PFY2_9EURY|nr:hypothetical protein [Natrinema salifodinae]SEW13357.1 LVIVD repeat-containing protein [Natrinema salifodinae]